MASLLFREMKGAKFSCASPASAAICTSIDRRSIVRPGPAGRAIDRHTPRLRDPRRANARNLLTQSPSNPTSYTQKSRRSTEAPPDHPISPAGSTRYLLNDTAFFDAFPDFEPAVRATPAVESPRLHPITRDESGTRTPSSSSSSRDQVVVLRVSLHCKGCEGKVRKHISKMEGVTSFSIDLATKKVTVTGNVTPLGVLNSVSKVKSAEFWP